MHGLLTLAFALVLAQPAPPPPAVAPDGEPLPPLTEQRLLAADSTDTVYQSTDAGRTWKVLHQPTAQTTEHH